MRKLIKTFEYGSVPNSYDVFKAIALITMIIDHVGFYLFPNEPFFRVIGRIAFPIFLFLVGYSRSYRFDPWLLLAAFAVLLSHGLNGVPMMPLNILFGIALWRAMMGWLEKRPHLLNDTPMLWVAMLVFYLPAMFLTEYGTLGLMFAVLGWHVRQGRDDKTIRLTWLATTGIWIGLQAATFGFTGGILATFITFSVVLSIALMQFKQRDVPLPPNHQRTSPTVLEAVVILAARNTLLLYVLHVVALQIVAATLYPEFYSEMFLLYRLK